MASPGKTALVLLGFLKTKAFCWRCKFQFSVVFKKCSLPDAQNGASRKPEVYITGNSFSSIPLGIWLDVRNYKQALLGSTCPLFELRGHLSYINSKSTVLDLKMQQSNSFEHCRLMLKLSKGKPALELGFKVEQACDSECQAHRFQRKVTQTSSATQRWLFHWLHLATATTTESAAAAAAATTTATAETATATTTATTAATTTAKTATTAAAREFCHFSFCWSGRKSRKYLSQALVSRLKIINVWNRTNLVSSCSEYFEVYHCHKPSVQTTQLISTWSEMRLTGKGHYLI